MTNPKPNKRRARRRKPADGKEAPKVTRRAKVAIFFWAAMIVLYIAYLIFHSYAMHDIAGACLVGASASCAIAFTQSLLNLPTY